MTTARPAGSVPNIVLIMSDQHNPHNLGCYGDPLVRTPHLDGLAERGVLFEHTYCASPLCVPSRMTFLTGRHCCDIGVWTNSCALPSQIPTFAHALGAAGYETVLGGRMHFVGPDQRHGFERRIIGDVLSPFPGGPAPDLGPIPMSTTGQTRVAVEISGPGRTAYQAYDVAVTDACCRFLTGRDAAADRPFCLVVGYVLPHCPFICPRDLYEEYLDQVDIPSVPEGYLDDLHPVLRAWRRRRGVDELDESAVRRARAAYFGLVTCMDQQIGRLLQTLADSPWADDTAVVYASDHGEMAGELGMWWKSSFYEGSASVPMIWSWPGEFAEGARTGAVTSLLDIAPTLTQLAGADPLPGARGTSLCGFLEGGAPADWPDVAFAESCNGGEEPAARMVRRGRWKLNHFHGGDAPQLFDLEADPAEIWDRGRDPACAAVRGELATLAQDGWDGAAVAPALADRARDQQYLRQWGRTASFDPADFWRAPPGCNDFTPANETPG